MTIIEKIKQSVEGATGMPFLYHAAGELNELIARCGELPVAYSFLIDSGTIDDVNGRYHERVTIAVMFCDKTEFDFNALENEQIIDRMKVKAYKWMQSLRMSNALRVVSVNNTQRLYDNTTDILTGFAVNITLEDITGVGECELPDVVFEIKENGEYPVVGIDKVFVNVLPKSTDIVITENGEYYPNDYEVDAFSKVDVDVKPKLEDLTATDNGTYTPSEGFDGFGKVNVDLRGKVKPNTIKYNSVDSEKIEFNLVDYSMIKDCSTFIFRCPNLKEVILKGANFKSATTFNRMIYNCDNLELLDLENAFTENVTDFYYAFGNNDKIVTLNLVGVSAKSATDINNIFTYNRVMETLVGSYTIDEVINNNLKILDELKISISVTASGRLNRASLRALINGLAEVETTQTLTLGATLRAKLTEEDIAIAANKGWSIA